MNIKSDQASGPCDICHTARATVGALCKGATGRVCEVMWMCEACGPGAVDAGPIRDNIEQYFGKGATADF